MAKKSFMRLSAIELQDSEIDGVIRSAYADWAKEVARWKDQFADLGSGDLFPEYLKASDALAKAEGVLKDALKKDVSAYETVTTLQGVIDAQAAESKKITDKIARERAKRATGAVRQALGGLKLVTA